MGDRKKQSAVQKVSYSFLLRCPPLPLRMLEEKVPSRRFPSVFLFPPIKMAKEVR